MPENNQLMHYGVPGMKWGVRRAIGKQAREAARLGAIQKTHNKVLSVQEKKLKEAKQYGGDTKKLQFKVNRGRALAKKYMDRYDKLTKGLSEKDIKQGKRGVVGQALVAGFLAGPLGVVLTTSIPTAKAQRRALNGD